MKLLCTIIGLLMGFSVNADEKVSAYYTATSKDVTAVNQALATNGFEVLGTYQVNGDPDIEVVLFTNPDLLSEAKKDNRGFVAVLKLVINKKANEIRIQNPLYFMNAFMQKQYTQSVADGVKAKLATAFGELKDTPDALKKGDLADYHFMMGMPYYEDMIKVGSGNYVDCISKKGKVIFKKDLGGKTIMAIGLSPEVEGFPKKLNLTENSLVLPYTVVVEKDAKILHPKYFIALSFPRLAMGQFMTISDIPGKIEDQLICK